jgi:two-component system NarL family sensor kinase
MSRCQPSLALGVALYAALLVATLVSFRAPASLDIRAAAHAGGAVVTWVMPASAAWDAGVRPGDRLPGGAPMAGAPALVVTAQHGRILFDPEQPRLPGRAALVMLGGGGVILFIAVLILVHGRGVRAAGALAAPLFLVGLILAVAPATSASRAWALGLMFGGLLVLGPAFLYACQRLAQPKSTMGRLWRLSWGAMGLLVVGGLASYVLAVATGGVAYPLARLLDDASLTIGLLTGGSLVLWRLIRRRAAQDAPAPMVFLLCTALGLLPLIAFLDGTALLHFRPMSPELATVGLLLLPASYAYAVRRHHMPDLPSIWNRRLARTLGAAVLAGMYLLLFDVLLVRLSGADGTIDTLPFALVVFVLGGSVLPVSRGAASCIDRVLFHDAYSQHDAIRLLVESLGAATDVRSATAGVLQDVRRWLNLRWLAVLTQRDGEWTLVASDEGPGGDGAACLAASGVPGPPGGGASPAVAATFPVPLGTQAEGVLLVGPKANGEPLRRGGRDVLTVLATMLGAPLARAQLLLEAEERAAELQALSHRLLAAQEQERQRVAVELHDGPLQRVHHLLRLQDSGAAPGECRDLTDRISRELRATCISLRPPALDGPGLPIGLASLARDAEPWAGCPITVEAEGYVRGRLPLDAEFALYRIAREALNNCARHSGASAIAVLVQLDAQEARLTVRDDGMGFAAHTVRDAGSTHAHLGLVEMRECALAWGGDLTIDSAPDEGTVVCAVLPCPGPSEEGVP